MIRPVSSDTTQRDQEGRGGHPAELPSGTSSGTATQGSGTVTETGSASSSTKSGAAVSLRAPFDAQPLYVSAVALGFTFLGAVLL